VSQATVRELLEGYLLAKHTVSSNLCSIFLASWIAPLYSCQIYSELTYWSWPN